MFHFSYILEKRIRYGAKNGIPGYSTAMLLFRKYPFFALVNFPQSDSPNSWLKRERIDVSPVNTHLSNGDHNVYEKEP